MSIAIHSLLAPIFAGCLIHLMCWNAISAPTTFTGLGNLPNGYLSGGATAVSDDGTTVVGGGGSPLGPQAFRWTQSTGMVGLGDLPGEPFESLSNGVSADGTIVVGLGHSGSVYKQAFHWTADTGITGLGYLPGGYDSRASAVSADGSVVVGSSNLDHSQPTAARWKKSESGFEILSLAGTSRGSATDVSSDGHTIVGHYSNPYDEAFVWTEESGLVGLGYLPGGIGVSIATAISSDGSVVVGRSDTEGFAEEAFRWTAESGMVGLGYLPGGDVSSASGVSSFGRVVVGRSNSDKSTNFESFAFRWTQSEGIQDLRELLIAHGAQGLDGWILYEATDVSSDGTRIVGHGLNPSGNIEAWIATLPIPEPGTLALLFLGGMLLTLPSRY